MNLNKHIISLLYLVSVVIAAPPEWEDNPGAYEFTATMTAKVILQAGITDQLINLGQTGSEGDILAAFDNYGNIRGLAVALEDIPFGPYEGTTLYEMQIRSDSEGDEIHFKFYNASMDDIIELDQGYTFEINGIEGSAENPIELTGNPFHFHQSTLQAFYYIDSVAINGVHIESSDWVVAYKNELVVGARKWDTGLCGGGICDIPVMGADGWPENNGYMHPGELPEFKIYDASTDAVYNATPSENFPWTNNSFSNIEFLFASTLVPGCTDPLACNYDPSADSDNGSCTYPEGNCDCDGNPADGECDCDGSMLDECGICGGDASTCADCEGTPNGEAYYDNCSVCDANPDNDCQQDCTGVWGGSLVDDECGVCGGDNAPNTGTCDCNGTANGEAFIDGCGDCVGGDTGVEACPTDCLGIPGGDAVYDNCGICDADPSNDCVQDCAGTWGGSLENDECGICGGSGPMTHYDCDGNCLLDSDSDGICDANELSGCTDTDACNYNNDATDENGSCVYEETNPNLECIDGELVCAAGYDNCGTCGGNNSECWFIDIEASISGPTSVSTDNTVIGMHIAAEDLYNASNADSNRYQCNDCYKDVINPIPQPGGQYIDVYFPHHDWEDIPFGSADLTQDIHKFFNLDEADADYEKKWKVVVESNVSFSNVELSFDLSNQLSPLEFARVFIDRNGVYTELFTNGSNEFIFILDNFTGYEEFNIVVSKPEAAVRIIYPNGGDIIDRSANSLIVELKYVMVDFIQRLQLYYEIEGNSYFLGDYSPVNEVVVSIADSLDSDGFIEEIMDDVVLVARIIDKNGENDALHPTYKDVSDNPFIIAKNQIQLFDDQFGWHLATPPLGSESGNHSISSIFNTVPENILSYDTGAGNLSYASSQIAADEGFYLFNDVPMTGSFSGIVNTGPHTITVNTGWNLIGNPLVSEVTIDSVLVNGEYWYDAAANGSIAPTPIIFDNATATHKGTDYLEMGTGFWIYAYSDGTEISFPPHLQNIEDSGEHSDGWLITLNAREANLSPDNFAYSIGSEVKIGVHEFAWDSFREGEDQESIPFGNPFTRYAHLSINDAAGSSLYKDIRSPFVSEESGLYNSEVSWELSLNTEGLESTETSLNWSIEGNINYYNFSLLNAETDAVLVSDLMNTQSVKIQSDQVSNLKIIARLKSEYVGCTEESNICYYNTCSNSDLNGVCLGGDPELECLFCSGCTDIDALNYDPNADEVDNDLCIYEAGLFMPEYVQAAQDSSFNLTIQLVNEYNVEIEGLFFVLNYNSDVLDIDYLEVSQLLSSGYNITTEEHLNKIFVSLDFMETGPIFSSSGDLLTVYGHASGNPGDATDISFNVIQINEYPSDGNTCQFSIIAHEFNVYGSVQYYSPPNYPIPDADMVISSMVESSNDAGNFTFLGLNAGAYEISPSKSAYNGSSFNYFDGLSAVDASRIARYLNGEFELDDNQKHAASLGHYICKNGTQTELAFTSPETCMANGYVWTPNITAQSHANIAKYAAGIIEDLGVYDNIHWLFIDPQGAIMNIQSNGSVNPYLFEVKSNVEIPTFKGIRLGDVTGNWSAPPGNSGRISQELIPGELNLNYTEGKTFSLPIYLPDATEIEGIDMSLAFDPEVVRFTSFHFSNDQLHSDDIAVVINEHHSGEVRLASYALRQVKSVQGELGYVEFEVIADKATQSNILITELFVNEIEAGGFLTEKDGSQFITSTMEVTISQLPLEFALNQNYPNPFNPVTHIDFELSQDGIVTVSIFDMKGALIEHLVNGWMAAGYHQVTWQGNHLSSGLYIVRMDAAGGEVSKTIKMTLIK